MLSKELLMINKFTSFNALLCYVISIFNSFPLVMSDLQCKNQGDCNDGNRVKCGVCINNDHSEIGKCIFPFPYQFQSSNKCIVVSTCEERNNCSNHGTCETSPISRRSTLIPGCACNKRFYGRACEYSVPKDVPEVSFPDISVEFVGIQNPVKKTSRMVFYKCRALGGNVIPVTTETESNDGGFYDIITIRKGLNCKDSYVVVYLYTYSRFPYIPYGLEENYKILRFGNTVLGYLSSFKLEFKVDEVVNYQHSFAVFVSYEAENLVCIPVVKLSGCGSKRKNENVFVRSNYIKISSNVFYIANGRYVSTSKKSPGCEENVIYHWRVWDGDHDSTISNTRTNPVLEYYEVNYLSFDPYSLNLKSYEVLLEVTSMQKEPSQNFAYCYFSIKFIPLVAAIDDGSERRVDKRYGLTLRSSRSHDPNMPPDKQGHMQASWSCVDVLNPKTEICDPRHSLSVSKSYIVPSENLRYGAEYNITLKVWTNYYDTCTTCGNVGPAYDFAIITVGNKTDKVEDYIYIHCLLNCKQKVIHNQQLYLRVKTYNESTKKDYQFEWTYYEEGQTTEKDTKNLTVDGLPSFMFLVKENGFDMGKRYVIVVRIVSKQWLAKYTFQTQEVELNGNCSLLPTNSGIKGLSMFEIQCQNFSGSPIYEFYDKTPEEVGAGIIFNGRMLGTSDQSEVGELKNFRVTRGQILVYIIDSSGLYTQKQFTVELLPWNVTEEVIGEVFFNLTELLNQGENEEMLAYISSVADVIPFVMDKNEILSRLLYFITIVPIDTLADIKLTTSTLTNVLISLNKPVQLAIEPELMRDILHIVRNQTYILNRIVSEGTDLKGMSPQEIRLVVTYQLNCLHAALKCKDPRTVGITEFDYDLKTLDDLMGSTSFVQDAIYLIKDILTFLQTPGQPPTKISSTGNSYVLWVVENDEEYNLTNYLSHYENIPAVVSNKLLQEFGADLKNNNEQLAVRVATLDENIFWWSKSDIKSNLVSVTLAKHTEIKNLGVIKFVKNVIGMKISLSPGLNSTQISGVVMPYNDSKMECTLEKDLTIVIYRIDPEPLSLISLTFVYPQTTGSLYVLVEKNYRPDCFMMKKAIVINETSPAYPTIISYKEEPTFYFVGVTPKNNVSVTYTFELNTTVCQFWASGHWSSKGCKISHTTKNLEAYCECDHFSIFGAAFPVPPQEIDLFSDIKLFLTVFENPLVVSFVSILFIIYLICCFWAWCRDKQDKPLKNVIILEDNFPEDSFPYLLAVYTSSRLNAGTTAHVGVKIKGSSASSRSHILSSKERKVLKRNYDDWFLLYCPDPLGDLQSIHLWHDNAGSSPDWFCDKVLVYDLNNGTETVFVVEQWIALRLTYFPEAIVGGASVYQVNNVKRMFLDNCVLGLRESHTLLCIILRHPRSEISRLQRISVLMCCVMASMLCSIMFYSPQVDDHEYSVGLRDFYISVQSLVVSLLTTALVLYAFKKSYEYKYTKTRSTIQYRSSGYKELEEASMKANKDDKSAYSNFVRFVSKTMKGQPLIPAQLEDSEPVVIQRKVWRVIAWVLCIGVIATCSFFIMLYGLKLGLTKSKIWLSSVLFTLSEDFFFSTPLRIIFFSIILSITFQKICENDNHRLKTEDLLTNKPPVSAVQVEKMLTKRRHQMYAPLRSEFKNEMLKKKQFWYDWWTVIDFTVALSFIFVVSVVVNELWGSHYYSNSHAQKIFTSPQGSDNFFSLRDMSQVDIYLEHSFLRSLYITFWYNENPIQEKDIEREYWAEDFTHTMVGYQRYRQIRVTPVKCKFTFMNTTRKCLIHYSDATEDTGDYSLRWEPAQWHDIKQPNSSWKYTDMSRARFSTLYRLCGESGEIFHSGGYLADLGPTKELAESVAYEIVSNNWQDQLTRAIFVEFTVYNINMDLFSQVTIIVEYLISGTILLKAQSVSVESKMKLSFWNSLFVAFIVYYVFRCGYLINHQGLFEYLSTSSRNRSRLVIVFLGALSISVAAIHFFSSTAYYSYFINRGYGDTYFDFDTFVYYFTLLQSIMSFLLAVAIFRTIFIFRGGRTLLNYFYTFTMSTWCIFWLTVVVCMFLLVQVPLIISLNIFSFYGVEEIVMNLQFTQYFKKQSSELKYLQIFLYVKCAVVNFMLCLYILIFRHYYRIARSYKMRTSDKFNIISFVLDQLKITKRKK